MEYSERWRGCRPAQWEKQLVCVCMCVCICVSVWEWDRNNWSDYCCLLQPQSTSAATDREDNSSWLNGWLWISAAAAGKWTIYYSVNAATNGKGFTRKEDLWFTQTVITKVGSQTCSWEIRGTREEQEGRQFEKKKNLEETDCGEWKQVLRAEKSSCRSVCRAHRDKQRRPFCEEQNKGN